MPKERRRSSAREDDGMSRKLRTVSLDEPASSADVPEPAPALTHAPSGPTSEVPPAETAEPVAASETTSARDPVATT
eukprot:3196557-Prymnesium_polylepis.1